MTSERQRAANRKNAGRSTGPRTKSGKERSRANRRTHGLAASVWDEPNANAEITRLADAIVVDAGRPDLRAEATSIAEAEFDLRRIRRARERCRVAPPVRYRMKVVEPEDLFLKAAIKATRRKVVDLSELMMLDSGRGARRPLPAATTVAVGKPLPDRTPNTLDRYERRAMSRRKSAIRAFDEARATGPTKE